MLQGQSLSKDRVWEDLIDEVDQDGDGEIDLREFEDLLLSKP